MSITQDAGAADIEVRVVPGSHDTMVRTPYVAGLAEELGRFLGSARTAA